jgi:hypothetical protein
MFSKKTESCLPLKEITDRGYAIATMPTRDIYREWTEKMEFRHGVFNVVKSSKPRDKHSWASISAWAWGVSRVVDYLEEDPEIDASRIASIGHSRSGKAALYDRKRQTGSIRRGPDNQTSHTSFSLRNRHLPSRLRTEAAPPKRSL